MRSWFGFPCFGLRAAVPPKLCATLRSCRRCVWLCASWSAGTPRRRHARIDRPVYMSGGACFCWSLVLLPVLVLFPAASTSSAASGPLLANIPSARPCGRSFAPELLTPSCSCRLTATLRPLLQHAPPAAWLGCDRSHGLLLGDLILSLFCHVVDVMFFLTDLLSFVVLAARL